MNGLHAHAKLDPWRTFTGLAFAVVGMYCVKTVGIASVVATSMAPTLLPGQHVLIRHVNRIDDSSALEPRLARGQVVVLWKPRAEGERIVKRVVALAGDRVSVREGLLFVNGEVVREPYAGHKGARWRRMDSWPRDDGEAERVVPEGHIFVLGDNRSESVDSRAWGPVALKHVTGVVIVGLPF